MTVTFSDTRDQQWRRTHSFSLRQGFGFFFNYFEMNTNKRLRQGSSSSSMSDVTDSEPSLKSVMEKLNCIQQSLDSNFAEAMGEINNLRTDVNAKLLILKNDTDELKTSLDAAWIEIEALKQQDDQNKLQLQQLQEDNAHLEADLAAAKARAIKLENYTRRENIRLLNVPENEEENCKEIVREVMDAVKMEGANKVEFNAVHRTGKQRNDGKPRAIIARFVNREARNDFWNRRKELANSPNHQNVVLVPDYAYETAKEQKKLSNALRNARKLNLTPAYIKKGRLFVQGNSYLADSFPEFLREKAAVSVDE